MERLPQRGSAVVSSEEFESIKSAERTCGNGYYFKAREIEGKLLYVKKYEQEGDITWHWRRYIHDAVLENMLLKADKLNVSFQAISQWENGTTYPNIEILRDLSIVLDVSADEILISVRVPIDKNEHITKGIKNETYHKINGK